MLTIENLKYQVPTVFAQNPSSKLSNKYKFIPTIDIVEKFSNEGWNIMSAKQVGRGNYGSHEIRMSNVGLPKVGDSIFQAVIQNSHDGTKAFTFKAGLFRLVCGNGLTVPTTLSQSITLRHLNIEMGEIRRITDNFAEQLPIIQGSVEVMSSRILTENEQYDFAQKSKLIKWKESSLPNLTEMELLRPLRSEDSEPTVWNTFNILQEKFVKGGMKYMTNKNRNYSSKELKNFNSINKINTELWELAESYC